MKRAFLSLTVAATLAAAAHADPHNVYGKWVPESGSAHIEIADCGDGTPCGNVVWIDPDTLRPGDEVETVVDANGDRVMGLKMLYGFTKKRNDWRSGTIYDPEVGKTYGSRIKLRKDDKLQVKGCVYGFCQTQIWDRAPEIEAEAAEG